MEDKTIDLVNNLMDRYGESIRTDLKENQKIFDYELYTNMPIDKYFEIIDECIHYVEYENKTYTRYQIINNTYNTGPIHQIKQNVAQEANIWKKSIQEVICRRLS